MEYPSENFWNSGHLISDFVNLKSCCILVDDIKWEAMTQILREFYWGKIPKANMRMLDARTREWIDLEVADPSRDYLDTVVGDFEFQYAWNERRQPEFVMFRRTEEE